MLTGDAALRSTEDLRALHRRDERDRTGRYVVEGARFAHSVLRARAPVVRAVAAPELLRPGEREVLAVLRRRVCVDEIDAAAYHALTRAAEPPGLALVVEQHWGKLVRPRARERALWIAFGEVRSPGNLGTTLRTAAAAGVRGALFLDLAADPFDPVAVRASMGAVVGMPIARVTPQHLGAWRRRTGVLVVGSSAQARRDIRDLPARRTMVVMLGAERHGMTHAQRRVCDVSVRIPMAPGTDSLNIAVAAGVLLFAARDRVSS